MAWQWSHGLNPDVTWLTVACERLLDGERLFVDLLENNPPASVYIYAPGIAVARLLQQPTEASVQLWVLSLAVASYCLSAAIFRYSGYLREYSAGWLTFGFVAFFLLMPAATFAQKEHVAAILSLPVVAIGALRVAGARPRYWMMAAVGVAGGCVAAIKPPMAMVLVLVACAVALHRRSFAPDVRAGKLDRAACPVHLRLDGLDAASRIFPGYSPVAERCLYSELVFYFAACSPYFSRALDPGPAQLRAASPRCVNRADQSDFRCGDRICDIIFFPSRNFSTTTRCQWRFIYCLAFGCRCCARCLLKKRNV